MYIFCFANIVNSLKAQSYTTLPRIWYVPKSLKKRWFHINSHSLNNTAQYYILNINKIQIYVFFFKLHIFSSIFRIGAMYFCARKQNFQRHTHVQQVQIHSRFTNAAKYTRSPVLAVKWRSKPSACLLWQFTENSDILCIIQEKSGCHKYFYTYTHFGNVHYYIYIASATVWAKAWCISKWAVCGCWVRQ